MSDVLIKGMKIPDCCFRCPFKNYYGMWVRCIFTRQNVEPEIRRKTKASSCPLIEVPTPHGRLIEEEPIIKYITDGLNSGKFGYDAIEVLTEIKYAPTIIPAEEGE